MGTRIVGRRDNGAGKSVDIVSSFLAIHSITNTVGSTLNRWTTVHDLRQKKCEPEDVPGSSSSESEGKISCHSRLLEFPKKRQTLTKAWFPYDRCDRCDRSLRNKSSAIVAIAATTIAKMELFSYLCGRCRCDRWKLVSL